MLGDLLWYPWHVRRLPCEDIAIVAQEVDKLAFLFGRELGPDPHCLGWVSGVDLYRLGFLERAEGRRGGGLLQSRTARVDDSLSRESSDELMTVVASSKCSWSHVKACEKVLLTVITPFGPGIFSLR